MPTNAPHQGLDSTAGDPLADLDQATAGGKYTWFPQNLETLDHWIRFAAVKRSRSHRDSNLKVDPLISVYLPVPQQLGTGYDNKYNDQGIGALGELGKRAGDLIQDFASGKQSIGNIVDRISQKSVGSNMDAFKKALAEGGSLAANFLLSGESGSGISNIPYLRELIAGATYGAGIATNPHKAMLFSHVNFRIHKFDYDFIATNEAESKAINKIIWAFKYHAAPSYKFKTECFFEYPDEFLIQFHYPKYLFTIAPSVLTGLTVNYHGSGQPAYFYGTHAPAHVTLGLEFTETSIVTKESIQQDGR